MHCSNEVAPFAAGLCTSREGQRRHEDPLSGEAREKCGTAAGFGRIRTWCSLGQSTWKCLDPKHTARVDPPRTAVCAEWCDLIRRRNSIHYVRGFTRRQPLATPSNQ
jgi:hypothetical protein